MPYFQRAWNILLGDKAPKTNKNLRTVPASEYACMSEYAQDPSQQKKPLNVDEIKVVFTRNMLKKQVEEVINAKAAEPLKGENNFLNYVIQKDQVIFKGKYSTIYACYNHQYSDNVMICRIFEPSALINPDNDIYLKILRHLGKKHPCIIGTMDIFADDNRHIYLFQEFSNRGNSLEFLRSGNVVSEAQLCKWAQNIYRAMDYLGDVGIAHRAIQPKHVLLKANDSDIQAKLSSFRSAIVYWDPETNDIIDQPCKSLSKKVYASFQAPEVFGKENEFYNPIEADVWSYGATMFFLISRLYPYNPNVTDKSLDEEIYNTIGSCRTLSDAGKNWCFNIMRTNTAQRIDFDQIPQDPWFKSV